MQPDRDRREPGGRVSTEAERRGAAPVLQPPVTVCIGDSHRYAAASATDRQDR